ncbi:MAG: tetratricopeptide repeat protein [Rhodospirillales bacterium]|nr:tetratricopeptide repeat protein [Rhodospirillales bacterium]
MTVIQNAGGRGRRATAAAGLLMASLLMACAANEGATGAAGKDSPAEPGSSISGNYLAARHAGVVGDDQEAASFLTAALAQSPDDPVLLGRAYSALAMDGRVAEAVEVARRFIAVEQNVALPYVVVATGDIHDGRFDDAVRTLDNIPHGPLSLFLTPVLKAWADFGAGRIDAATADLGPLKANPPTATLYDVHAAWLSDAAGDSAAALAHARDAVAAQPEPWFRLADLAGQIFERAGQPAEAAAVYERYLSRHPDSQLMQPGFTRLHEGVRPGIEIATAQDGAAEVLFDAAGIAGRQNSRETALVFGRLGLYLRPDFPELQILIGDMLESDQRLADANEVYAGIDPNSPLSVTAQIGIARNLDRLGHFDEAQRLLRQLAAERPSDADPLTELADILRRKERFAEAVEVYDEAIARIGTLQPRHWRLLYARGIALERSNQWPRAESDFVQALKFEPDQPFVLNYLGYSWVEQGRNLDQAEAMIRKAVELQPNDGYIVDSLGWVLFRLGRYDEAVIELEQAVELRPEDAAINDHLGDAYWTVGRQREARYQWMAALASGPEAKLKAEIEKKLERGLLREANAGVQ